MDKETRNTIIAILITCGLFFGAISGIALYSGVSPFSTTVISPSMQHDSNQSTLGSIDTGDMVIVKEYDSIQTYVDGYISDYSRFGEYGDVIIYDRGPEQNPVIHRAILYLELNDDGKTWNAPSLENYPKDLWSNGGTYDKLEGWFSLIDKGHSKKTVSVNLDSIDRNTSNGYLTMGDNNFSFDQPSISHSLITEEQIKSVAWFEVPWIGCVKLLMSGETTNIDKYAPNSVPNLAITMITFVLIIFTINYLFDYRFNTKYKKMLDEELIEELIDEPPSP